MLIDACCTIKDEGDGALSAGGLIQEMDLAGVERALARGHVAQDVGENLAGRALVVALARPEPRAIVVLPEIREELDPGARETGEGRAHGHLADPHRARAGE